MRKAPKKILLVDDTASVLLILTNMLTNAGYDVLSATDPLEALAILEAVDISLIITDQLMPNMKGSEFCALLRSKERYQSIPILCLTSADQSEVIREIYASGASDYIKKPVVDEELLACVAHQISVHAQRLELELSNLSLHREIIEHQHTSEALRQALQQSRQATEVKNRFLANMSHELRTPLNGILGFTELAMEQLAGNPAQTDLQLVKDASTAMLHLIDDIISLSQLETGCLTLDQSPFDLYEVFQDLQGFFEIQCASTGKVLVLEIAEDVPRKMLGDVLRLKQIFMTLVANAVKFTTSRGAVLVYIHMVAQNDAGATLGCSVNDNGVGICKEKIPGLFQAFSQLDSSSTREHGGVGIGLAIAKQLIELMHGEIEVMSIPDVGSSFRFTLSLQRDWLADPAPVSMTEAGPNTTLQAPVLVVEDNPLNQKLLTGLLRKRGLPFLVANNGQEAIETLQNNQVSIVLMDCHMPVLDGYEATLKIRSLPEQAKRDVPVVAISASISGNEQERCLEVGMDAVVQKPIASSTLFNLINQFTSAEIDADDQQQPVAAPEA